MYLLRRILLCLLCFELVFSIHNERLENNESTPDSNDLVVKLNGAIDVMLKVARFFFTKHGQLTIPLPSINRTFGHGLYTGLFTSDGGYFRNIGSLHRTGDVAFTMANDTLSLNVAMGLSEIVAGYSNYTLSIVKIRQSGNLTAGCANNSIMMKMTFMYKPKCSFVMEYIKFEKLDGIAIDITGLGAFQALFDEISSWIITNFEDRFRTISNDKMHERLQEVLTKKSDTFCKYFPHF